jgi:photosystem II stability/assembly factor-like uncharacterized protein
MPLLVATESRVLLLDDSRGTLHPAEGLDPARPTCLAADPHVPGRAWCGTDRHGVFRSDDGGASWRPVGLRDRRLMSLASSPAEADVVWAGTEPSAVWRSGDGGLTWAPTAELEALPSSPTWSFPPKPETHHVRWIAGHPREPGRLWVAIEAGALVSTADAGRTWRDRVPGGPWDTHELAVHPDAPETLRVSAGDGYFESFDGGVTWDTPGEGLEVGYLRSVAIDPGRPDVVVVSAASHPHSAYGAGRSDGRLYRRVGRGRWERIRNGWPDPPDTIAPLLIAGRTAGELWAADERGIHRSDDGGSTWQQIAAFPTTPSHLRALARSASPGAGRLPDAG